MSSNITFYKLLVLGDAGVGKTTFLKRHTTGDFEKSYLPTEGYGNERISFDISTGETIIFNAFDFPGQESLNKIAYEEQYGIQAIMIMFDLTDKLTWKNTFKWLFIARKNYPDTPIVICGNKIDINNRKVKSKDINFEYPYWEISAKSCYNFEKPFLHLIRVLKKDNEIDLK